MVPIRNYMIPTWNQHDALQQCAHKRQLNPCLLSTATKLKKTDINMKVFYDDCKKI